MTLQQARKLLGEEYVDQPDEVVAEILSTLEVYAEWVLSEIEGSEGRPESPADRRIARPSR